MSCCLNRELTNSVTLREIIHEYKIKEWHSGDPFPVFSQEVGVDTETELITDTNHVPPLVVLGIHNDADKTCYIISYEDAQVFMQYMISRQPTIYLANAGFDYYELHSKQLEDHCNAGKIIDVLLRCQLREIATIGFQTCYSLKASCAKFLKYAMDKHEEEGEASVRLNFKQSQVVSEEQLLYLSLDCITTWALGKYVPPQANEEVCTQSQIVLTHIENNGLPYDQVIFDAFEKTLSADMEKYRQQLLSYGYPDPEAKNAPSATAKAESDYAALRVELFNQFIPGYLRNIPRVPPGKGTIIRCLVYIYNYATEGNNQLQEVCAIATCLIQGKNPGKKEKELWEEISERYDFGYLEPVKTKSAWLTLLTVAMRKVQEGASCDDIFNAINEEAQQHQEWFGKVEKVGPKKFLQDHLKKLMEEYPKLELDKTEKSGDIKCSKKDSWKLEDAGCKDPFLDAYMNYTHVQKYMSCFCNRAFLKSDNKVHCHYGMVATMRTSSNSPNLQQLPSHSEIKIKNIYRAPRGCVFVSTDYSFIDLVALAQTCITKYGYSVLGTIINSGLCPHYFFAGTMVGLISPSVDFCKDPAEVAKMSAFLKEHIDKETRGKAKALNFGLPGGMSSNRLYKHMRDNGIKTTFEEADRLRTAWLNTFPEMQEHFKREPIKEDRTDLYYCGEEEEEEEENTRALYKVTTFTGFTRNRATKNAAMNTDFQQIEAYMARKSLWNLERAGYGDRLINMVHDEVDYWLYPEECRDKIPQVEAIWLQASKEVFPDVKLKCDSALCLHWDKGATEYADIEWNANGTPILEEPEFVKEVYNGNNGKVS